MNYSPPKFPLIVLQRNAEASHSSLNFMKGNHHTHLGRNCAEERGRKQPAKENLYESAASHKNIAGEGPLLQRYCLMVFGETAVFDPTVYSRNLVG